MSLKLLGAGTVLLASLGMIFARESELSEHKRQLEEFGLLLSLLFTSDFAMAIIGVGLLVCGLCCARKQ